MAKVMVSNEGGRKRRSYETDEWLRGQRENYGNAGYVNTNSTPKKTETRNYLEKEFNNRGGSSARIVKKSSTAAPAKKTTAKGAWTQAEKEAAMRERRAAAQAQGKGNWNAEAEMKKRREAAMAKKKKG